MECFEATERGLRVGGEGGREGGEGVIPIKVELVSINNKTLPTQPWTPTTRSSDLAA